MLRVLIADDHAIVRKGLIEILRERPGQTVVGEAADGDQALRRVQTEPWDVVVLDITMPGPGGLAVLKQLRHMAPHLPVLMLSMHSSRQYVVGSLQAGAAGYLSKESAPEELVTAITSVLAGERYVSRALLNNLEQ